MSLLPKASVHSADIVDHVCDARRSQRLFKRCNNPTLPARHPLYSQAKKLEYDGDIAGALDFLYRAMMNGERVDSCLKDIAGLLNMMGRTAEAVEFLKSHSDKVVNRAGYSNLIAKLQTEVDKEESSDLPRGITVTVIDESLGPVTLSLCDRLFPNPAKVRRILYTDERGFVGAVHFASHSSARKALQIHKICPNQVMCSWSSLYTDARLRMLERMEKGASTVGCHLETLPPHLTAFGGISSIPIYQEGDSSLPPLPREELERIQLLARARAEAAASSSRGTEVCSTADRLEASLLSEISPVSPEAASSPAASFIDSLSTTSPHSGCESIILSAIQAGHHQITKGAHVHGPVPFITRIPNLRGDMVSAVVIPFPSTDIREGDQVAIYTEMLTRIASVMAGVGTLIESGTTLNPLAAYTTPVKPKRGPAGNSFTTPSPVIERYLFT